MSITSFTSTLAASLRWSQAEADELSTTTDTQQLSHTVTKTFGTGVGNANLIWHDTLAAATTLNPASLPRSIFGVGGTFIFSSLKTVRIKNAQETGNVTVTVPACGISAPVTLHPGAVLVLDSPTGWSVSGSIAVTSATAVEVVLIGVGTVSP